MTQLRESENKRTGCAAVIRFIVGIYVFGIMLSATYFNWTFARDNGFWTWLLLGEVVPTAKALIWPYYVFAPSQPTPQNDRPALGQGAPKGVQMFFVAMDALLEADERPNGIVPEANLRRVEVLLKRVIDASAKADREELNAIYPGWGDHFFDDAVAHARFMVQAIETRDGDAATRATAAFLRWQNWWKANQAKVTVVVGDRYGS